METALITIPGFQFDEYRYVNIGFRKYRNPLKYALYMMLLNTENTKVMLISTRQKLRLDTRLLSLTYNETDLQLTTGDKILGVYTDENFQWNNHPLIGLRNSFLLYLASV